MYRPQMPIMTGVAVTFQTRYRLKAGGFVMAQISEPTSTRTGSYESPRKILRCSGRSKLVAGSVVIGTDKRQYLLIDNGVKDSGHGVEYKSYKVVELTDAFDLYRSGDVLPGQTQSEFTTEFTNEFGVQNKSPVPAASLRTDKKYSKIGKILAAVEYMRDTEDSLRVATPRRMITTDYPLRVGDRLDNYEVESVFATLGIYRAVIS